MTDSKPKPAPRSTIRLREGVTREHVRNEIVRLLADLIVKDLEERPIDAQPEPAAPADASDWLTLKQAAVRLACSTRQLSRAIAANKLRAVRINERGDLRTRQEWLDEWLLTRKNF